MRINRTLVTALVLIGLTGLTIAVSAASVNVLMNGSFEDEFINGVGKYWTPFDNGGDAAYGYHDDTWSSVVYDGKYSQLLEMHTKAVGGSQKDRYMGVYQVADVVPGKRYMFSFYGMIRSSEGTEKHSKYNYRVQLGYDFNGGTDPWAVTDWVEMSRWTEHPLLSPGPIQSYAHGVTATTDKLTVFLRVWKKFPTVGEEANINIDAVSLLGPRALISAPAPTDAVEKEAATPALPKTGVGGLLPLAGLGLAASAIALTASRLRRSR